MQRVRAKCFVQGQTPLYIFNPEGGSPADPKSISGSSMSVEKSVGTRILHEKIPPITLNSDRLHIDL